MLLYNTACSKVQNNGWILACFTLGRGVRQGCPLSCHLFNLVSQITIYYLQSCGHFLWWTFVGDPNNLYADDIALIIETLAGVPGILRDLLTCSEYTGLYLNLQKTVVYDRTCIQDYQFHGVTDLNLSHAINKMRITANKW